MRIQKIIFITLLTVSNLTHAVTIGSDTSFSREAAIIFPYDAAGNKIVGFAALQGGFTLINQATTCSYNGFEPIGGIIKLNGGTFVLQEDLTCDKSIDIATVGTILGNGYTLTLANKEPIVIPSGEASGSTFTFKTKSVLTRVLNTVDWSYDSQYLVAGLVSGSGSDLYWYSFDGTTLTQRGSLDMSATVNSVRWHPSLYRFAVGRASGTSTELRVYDFSTTTNAITLKSGIELGANVKSVAWTPSGDHLIVTSEISGSTIDRLYIYSVNSAGVLTQVATVTVGSTVVFSLNALSWNPTGQYVALGLAKDSSLSEFQVYYFNGTSLTLNASVELGEEVRIVAWHPTLNIIAISLGGTTKEIRLYEHNSDEGTLTEIPSARVTGVLKVNSFSWSPDGNYLLAGRDTGSGSQVGVYFFDRNAQTLKVLYDLKVANSVNEVRWAPNGIFAAWADSNKELNIYEFDITSNGSLTLNGVLLELTGDITFLKPVNIQGNCVINGNGATITLGDSGAIQVDSGATLRLKDVLLDNVTGTNLSCADWSASINLQNVIIQQCGDYILNQGKMNFGGDVLVRGGYEFCLSSSQISTINAFSCLHCDSGTTLYYAPSITSQTLLSFADSTASLHLYQTTLKTSAVGMRLTKGTIYIEGTCPVINSGATKDFGLIFGDNVSSTNDITIKCLPESGLHLASGYLVYSNVAE